MNASVLELVDKLVSEASARKGVEVQVLSLAPQVLPWKISSPQQAESNLIFPEMLYSKSVIR